MLDVINSGLYHQNRIRVRKEDSCPCVLFFNGHKRLGSADVYLAQKIGEYWNNVVTKGGGTYWNCNANKKKYRYVGIGLIEASDATTRQNLLRSLMYLCKKETQAIKPRNQPQAKTLTRGDLRNKPFNLGKQRTLKPLFR